MTTGLLATPVFGLQAVIDGPDSERREAEDQRIGSATDLVERNEARLDAAAAALRLDLSPRTRTRLWWTPVDEPTRRRAAEVARRARTLADTTFTELLTSNHPAVDRLQARAVVIRAVADCLADRMNGAGGDDWTSRLARLHRDAGEASDRTSRLDGPTLLALSAAALAAGQTSDAKDRLARAGTVPDGIDALEFRVIERLVAGDGITPSARRSMTAAMLNETPTTADRVLLAAIHLASLLESGRRITPAVTESTRVLLPARGLDATDRVRLIRAFAPIAAAATPPSTGIPELPPVVALERLIRGVADGTSAAELEPLVRNATSAKSPDVRTEAWLEAAGARMRASDGPGTLEALLGAIESSPRHPKATAAGGLAIRLGERLGDDAFREVVERVLKAVPEHADRHRWRLTIGDRALAAGREAEARRAWEAIPPNSNVGLEAALRRLRFDIARMETADAAGLLEALEEIEARIPGDRDDPRRIDVDVLRMKVLLALDRSTSAADLAMNFVDMRPVPEPQRVEAAAVALQALEEAGREAKASELRTGLEALDPALAGRTANDAARRAHAAVITEIDRNDRKEVRRLAGQALGTAGVDLDAAIRTAGSDPEATLQLGWLLAGSDRAEEAGRLLEEIRRRHPDAIEALYLEAVLRGGRLAGSGPSRVIPTDEDAGEAIRLLTRINGNSPRGSIWWWRSEIEKLEILAVLEREVDRIEARLQRLATEYRDLGGPAFERRVRALREKIREIRTRE